MVNTTGVEEITIPQFYAGRHILITGGSGFIGKVLVEKTLRSCPDVAGIHLILREKKGVSPADRITKITEIVLFDELRKQNPNFEDKLHVVSGDVSLPGLGISDEARQFLIKNVSVVFHIAATVRFDDPLTRAILVNVRGTRDLALMAREMPNLAIFLHVSTTYCNVDRKVIDEKLYPPHGDWRTMIAAAEKEDPSTIDAMTSKIMGVLPNTYTYSKSLAEHCLHDVGKGKPFVIVRPSIVISTLLEPVKGWVDNFNGPVGLIVALGKGLIHINLTRLDLVADFMPVDLVAKAFLIAAYKHGIQRTPEDPLPIYNCSTAVVKPITNGDIKEMCEKVSNVYPLNHMIWEPQGIITRSKTVLLIGTLILHMIPAFFFDLVLRLSGQKTGLMRLQRRIYGAQLALSPFLLNGWVFKNDNGFKVIRNLSKADEEHFKVDYSDYDPYEYFRMVAYGGRRYLLKESDETLPAARKHRTRMYIINHVVRFLLLVWLLYVLPLGRIATVITYPITYLFEVEDLLQKTSGPADHDAFRGWAINPVIGSSGP